MDGGGNLKCPSLGTSVMTRAGATRADEQYARYVARSRGRTMYFNVVDVENRGWRIAR